MKTVIILTAAQDDLFSFVLKFAVTIQGYGDVALVLCTQPFDGRWQTAYQARGITLTAVATPPQAVGVWPIAPDIRLSEALAGVIRGANIVFFQDATAFTTVRTRRFSSSQGPLCVTFWDRPSDWLAKKRFPTSFGDLNSTFVARYAAEYSDVVIATTSETQQMLEGWSLSPRTLSIAAPDEWQTLYAELRALKKEPRPDPPVAASVDVCIPHFNHGKYLPQALTSLEWQNFKDFGVIVVDDCSTEAASRDVFEQMSKQYPRWRFVANTTNRRGAEIRQQAARLSHADYVCFVDADDVVAPDFVGRLFQAIQASGDDCLAAPLYSFVGDGSPYDRITSQVIVPAEALYMPLGSSLTASVLDNMLGASPMIIRRQVFLDTDLPPALVRVGYEDYEKYVRMVLAGCKMDVLPEYLYFYRMSRTGVSTTTDAYLNTQRILSAYREVLAPIGLGSLPLAIKSLEREVDRLRQRIKLLAQSLPERR